MEVQRMINRERKRRKEFNKDIEIEEWERFFCKQLKIKNKREREREERQEKGFGERKRK